MTSTRWRRAPSPPRRVWGQPRRAELLHVLLLPDFERAGRIGELWSYPESRTFAELLIDCEEGSGGVLVGRPTAQVLPRDSTVDRYASRLSAP